MVAQLVHRGPGGVTRGVHMLLAQHLQVTVHFQPAEVVAFAGNLCSQRAGLNANSPDHGVAGDMVAVVQGNATGIDSHHRSPGLPLDPGLLAGGDDRRRDTRAQRRTNLRTTVDHHHPQRRTGAEDGTQAGRHFRGGFNTCEATTADHHSIACRRSGQGGQADQVLFQAHGRFHLVDIECMFGQARHCRSRDLAARGKDQTVVGDLLLVPLGVGVADAAPFGIDAVGVAWDEVNAHGFEQLAQRGLHAVHIGLVEARANAQFRLRSEDTDADVGTLGLVEQARGAQGAPYTGKAGTDDEDVRFHEGAPQGSKRASRASCVPLE